jgi:hypothetical protein
MLGGWMGQYRLTDGARVCRKRATWRPLPTSCSFWWTMSAGEISACTVARYPRHVSTSWPSRESASIITTSRRSARRRARPSLLGGIRFALGTRGGDEQGPAAVLDHDGREIGPLVRERSRVQSSPAAPHFLSLFNQLFHRKRKRDSDVRVCGTSLTPEIAATRWIRSVLMQSY